MAWGSARPWGAALPWGGGSIGSAPAPDPDRPKTARQAVYRLLSTDAALDELVGGRVYPGWRPQDGPLPAVTMVAAGSREPRKLAGAAAYRSLRLRISAWGEDEEQAEEVADAIRSAIGDFKGRVGDVRIGSIVIENEIDLPEIPGVGGYSSPIYQLILECRVWHRSLR